MIHFNCPGCAQKMRTDDSCAGKQILCPKCGKQIQVPAPVPSKVEGPSPRSINQPNIIKFRCPGCDQKIGLDKSYAGKTVRCTKCKTLIQVPCASPAQEKRLLDIDLLLSPKPLKTKPSSQADAGDMLDGELLGEELLSAEANAPPDVPPGLADDGPLKLAYDEPKEKSLTQKRCPRCNSMNPADAAVCSLCAFELAASKAGFKRDDAGTNRPVLAAGLSILSMLLLGFIVWTVVSAFKQAKTVFGPRSDEAEAFALRYIDRLKNSDILSAKNLLTAQLQASVTNDQLDNMAKFVNKAKIADVNLARRHYEPNPQGNRYYLSYTIRYDDLSFRQLALSLREVDNNFKVDGAASNDLTGASVAIGPRNYSDFSQIFLQANIGILKAMMGSCCSIVIVMLVLAAIYITCLWVIFDKAGQPGWAAIVPLYNMWVLAEIGEKPGWLGMLAALSGFIPYVGPVISIVLSIIIYIGVAKSFNRGILFGIGLVFLSFIFFPILAFASD